MPRKLIAIPLVCMCMCFSIVNYTLLQPLYQVTILVDNAIFIDQHGNNNLSNRVLSGNFKHIF
jgi:hypothetical protein